MKNDLDVEIKESSVSTARIRGKREKSAPVKVSEKLAEKVGSTMTRKVMGQEVTFTLEAIPAKKIEQTTMVWLSNERDQELLDQYSLEHMVDTYEQYGQENPAIGRVECGITQVADGSCRRFLSKFLKQDYYIWVGELTDEQMDYLTDVGNQYRAPSAYENGQKALRYLKQGKTQEEAAKLVGKDRRVMMRDVKTAKLPKAFIKAFKSPCDLRARKGAVLFDMYSKLNEQQQEEVATFFEQSFSDKSKNTTEELINAFITKCGESIEKPKPAKPRELAMGATILVKNGKATINIPNASEEALQKVEDFISKTLSQDALDNC
ncbi:ParB/RepB/Spo0J family partition protein [Vibrio sp. S512-13]|uniref:ParB/RepB/Spo0J family partition protein n=1 Tax=Vibrio sp. S512-13 TaxID=1620394 RepID=UPI0005EEEE62|nr:ParB/RepB/Spo0J family partition protein [Vibrio sp. S512-13]KJQ88413.1 protein SopB [Vibrio sp. S512-13]KJQ88416.1 protein SopB [Vibrio sp. S512-13]